MIENMNPRMNPRAKAHWTAALRSGEYTQAKHAMRVVHTGGWSYCCLGVACDVWGGGRWDMNEYVYNGDESMGTLPVAMATRVGIEQHNPNFLRGLGYTDPFGNETEAYASELNDIYNFTFDQIADLVEYFL